MNNHSACPKHKHHMTILRVVGFTACNSILNRDDPFSVKVRFIQTCFKIKCLNQKKLIEVPRFSFSSHWFSFSMVNLTWVCSVTLEPLVWVFFTFLPLENTIAHKNLKDKNEKTDEKSFCNKLDTTWAFERLKICTKIKWLTPSVLLLAAAQPAMWKKGKQLHTQSNFQEV